jgi:DNA-binding MarR family transcriptional regulator
MARLRADIRRTGAMDHAQFRVLLAILHGASSTGDLAEAFEVSAPTMTRTVDVLVDRGWVTRERDTADRRRVLVRITREGRALLRRMKEESETHLAAILDGLDPDEVERLCDGLQVLREAVERHRATQKGGPPCRGGMPQNEED